MHFTGLYWEAVEGRQAGRLLGTGGAGFKSGWTLPRATAVLLDRQPFRTVGRGGIVCLAITIFLRMSGYRAEVPSLPEAEAEGFRV